LFKRTGLHWAAKENHAHVVEYLLGAGADPEVRNFKGQLAAELTSSDLIRQLLKFGNSTSQVKRKKKRF